MDEDASVLTPLQIRDKLIALAGSIIGKQKEEEMRQLLQFRPHRMRNGGVHTSEEIRYVGEYHWSRLFVIIAIDCGRNQSNSEGKMACMCPRL